MIRQVLIIDCEVVTLPAAPRAPRLVELALCTRCGSDVSVCGEVLCPDPLSEVRDA